MPNQSAILVIAGPTASGKSHYAQQWALQQGGEIINADSQQFYRGLDIGTGKVLPSEQKVAHHLLDILGPGEAMNAMDYVRAADEKIKDIQSRQKQALVVGGTGFYLRALLEGLDDLPSRDLALRETLEKRLAIEGPEALHGDLAKIDPAAATKIAPQDRSRLVRYLEIYQLSGQPPSQLMQRRALKALRYPCEIHWLSPPRDDLRERIARRVAVMLEEGWLGEVATLIKKAQAPSTWPVKPIGYRELEAHLNGETSLEETKERIIQKTRQYAKRQQTFFKGLFASPVYAKAGCSLKVFEEKSFFEGLLT